MNRKNWDNWDKGERIIHRIKENIYWDRKNDSIKKCLKKYLNDEQITFEAIIDFSAYKRKDLKNVISQIPHNKFKKYILISTDSIYEVCETSKTSDLEEIDSTRPESASERENLNSLDSYGNHKLK